MSGPRCWVDNEQCKFVGNMEDCPDLSINCFEKYGSVAKKEVSTLHCIVYAIIACLVIVAAFASYTYLLKP